MQLAALFWMRGITGILGFNTEERTEQLEATSVESKNSNGLICSIKTEHCCAMCCCLFFPEGPPAQVVDRVLRSPGQLLDPRDQKGTGCFFAASELSRRKRLPQPGDIMTWWWEKLQGWNGYIGLVFQVKHGMLYTIEGSNPICRGSLMSSAGWRNCWGTGMCREG